jgi:hypothetical protein
MNSAETIFVERDYAPWHAVMQRPEVMAGVGEFDLGAVLAHPSVTPVWCGHGGFLFHALDHLGFVYDLHAMFAPEGWGKHVTKSLFAALNAMFDKGARLITVSEIEGLLTSRPPLSFGFRPIGEFRSTPMGNARSWVLTQDAWTSSPAFKRGNLCLLP